MKMQNIIFFIILLALSQISVRSKFFKRKFTVALFDLDGTLIDTRQLYLKIDKEILNQFGYGKPLTEEDQKKIFGITKINENFIKSHKINQTADFLAKLIDEKLDEHFNEVKPFPKALEILKFFKKAGIKTAITTSTARKDFEIRKLAFANLMEYVDLVVTRDDVKHPKPASDIFIYAANKLGEKNMKNVIVFEDSIYGVKAALASGAFTVAVNSNHFDDPIYSKVDVFINSLQEFTPKMIGKTGKI